MKILVLNGSPRVNGATKQMINAFVEASPNTNQIEVVDVAKMNIHGCLACEYCHTRGNGTCIQKDDMQEIYNKMKDADTLILAAPIYYHGLSAQLKAVIDRFYSIVYPRNNTNIKNVAMFIASGDSHMETGAKFSYEGDFTGYLGLRGLGIYTNHDKDYLNKIRDLAKSL